MRSCEHEVATQSACNGSRALFALSSLLGLLALLGFADVATAQGIRPGDERPTLPSPAVPGAEPPALLLPAIPEAPAEKLGGGLAVFVREFEITGSTVFSTLELAAAVAPFRGREIRSEELLVARDAVTQLYVARGYATSGATLPDQSVEGGVVRLVVTEGALTEVEVTGNEHFRSSYFVWRLRRAGRAPLDVHRLESVLEILQRDPWIERIEAKLEPGARLGESRLRLHVTETRAVHLRVGAANDYSPAVGSFGGSAEAWYANLTGLGDVASVWFQGTEGLLDVEGRWEIPITPWDTRLRVRLRNTETKIVEEPFDGLDVKASSRTYGVELSQPLFRSERDQVFASLVADHRSTKTSVLGQDFCFEPQTSACDDPTVFVLRGNLEWTRSTQRDVFAVRSLLSVGIAALGATQYGDADVADGRFVAWLGQAQWAHVLPETLWSTQTVFRVDSQLSNQPLLSIERFAIGGLTSVRGYRENQLVRDSGVVVSGELRIPVWRDSLRRPLVELVPFMDYGYGWNDGAEPPEDTLWSLGVGARFTPVSWLFAEIFWGGRLVQVSNPGHDLQDEGVMFRVSINVF